MKEIISTLRNKNRLAVAILIASALVCLIVLTPAVRALITDGMQANEGQQAESGGHPGILSLDLPSKLPFKIYLPSSGGWGFVSSDEFHITNLSEHPIPVSLNSVYYTTSDANAFAISYSENLPDAGNNIFISLVCIQNGSSTSYTLSDNEIDTHTFWLESGETVNFFFEGVVNELGDMPWSDTNVQVSLKFVFIDINHDDDPAEFEYDEYDAYETEGSDYIAEEDIFEIGTVEYPYGDPDPYFDGEAHYYWDNYYDWDNESDITSDTSDGTDSYDYENGYENTYQYPVEEYPGWDDYYGWDNYYDWDSHYDNTGQNDWDPSSDTSPDINSDADTDAPHSSTDPDYYDDYYTSSDPGTGTDTDYDAGTGANQDSDIYNDPYLGAEPGTEEDNSNQTAALTAAIELALNYLGEAIVDFEQALEHYADYYNYFEEYANDQLALAILAAQAVQADAESALSAVYAAGYNPGNDAALDSLISNLQDLINYIATLLEWPYMP